MKKTYCVIMESEGDFMRYVVDHDFHIHSTVSLCCKDSEQTPQRILQYAKNNNYKKVCLTNHFWDESVKSEAEWHEAHRYNNLISVLPLPQDAEVEFLLGAETDIDYNNVLGISEERMNMLDFIVVATTHLHLAGNTVRNKIQTPEEAADAWLNKLKALLSMNLEWHKIGIAHLTCGHILKNETPKVISLLSDESLYTVFDDCSQKGVGIELNMKTLFMSEEEKDILLRPYFIAKDCGCKFYLGSDAHKTSALETAKDEFENIITLLDLSENNKFILKK